MSEKDKAMVHGERLGGTDGFRGVYSNAPGPGQINQETFIGLSYALVDYQLERGEQGPVVVAQDTRPSGQALRQAVIEGVLQHEGVSEVWDLGVAPTPVAQKIAKEFDALATIVVTASHNPHRDNGWKGLLGSDKPVGQEVQSISDRYWSGLEKDQQLWGRHHHGSRHIYRPDLVDWYIDEVVADIEEQFGEQPLRARSLVIDGANGAAQNVTPQILEMLGAEVHKFSCDARLGLINDGCGATALGGLKQFLTEFSTLISEPDFVGAVANDGDGDRMMAVGSINMTSDHNKVELVEVNGNHTMLALAQGEPGIVGTVYTNSGLVRRLKQQAIDFEYCDNGDVFVTQKLQQKQAQGKLWRRGGEATGHLIDLDWLSSGDGIRMAAWVAAFAVAANVSFGDLHQDLPLLAESQADISVSDERRAQINDDANLWGALEQAQTRLGDRGRLVLRPSGTQPLVRIWGEASDASQIKDIVQGLAGMVSGHSER